MVSTRSQSRLQAHNSGDGRKSQKSTSISWAEATRRAAKKGIILKDPRIWLRGRKMTRTESKLYLQALHESEGFDVPDYPEVSEDILRVLTVRDDKSLETLAMEAIRHYKTHVDENGDPKFVKVVKANFRVWGVRFMYYLTFEAIDHGQLRTYQAFVSLGFKDITVDFARLKPTPSSSGLTFETSM